MGLTAACKRKQASQSNNLCKCSVQSVCDDRCRHRDAPEYAVCGLGLTARRGERSVLPTNNTRSRTEDKDECTNGRSWGNGGMRTPEISALGENRLD